MAEQQTKEAMALDPNKLLEQDIKNVFSQLDVDQNGFLGAPDLVKCFRSLGEDLEDSLIDAMLAQIDADGDGQISLVEFRELVKTLENERGGLRPRGYDARLPVADRGALSKTATKTAEGGARDKRNDTSDSGKSRTVSSDSD